MSIFGQLGQYYCEKNTFDKFWNVFEKTIEDFRERFFRNFLRTDQKQWKAMRLRVDFEQIYRKIHELIFISAHSTLSTVHYVQ